jgi:hypothetical protein
MQSLVPLSIIACLFLANSYGVPLGASQSNSTMRNRNIADFGYLIWKYAGNPLKYNGYGCW